ncbi:DedA family protein [Pseudaeromonas pectinilytica]|nr:DedA family protein [Aeromonadaceae bacterium]MBP8126564.1 DedA family protein [Aeromonadaceae bacterium]
MDLLALILDFILHVDVHLQSLMNNYGLWVYAILFLIIFCETGLVVTPFLPGDSLLFAAGALTVGTALDVNLLAGALIVAAVLGNITNYTIGHFFGERLFQNPNSRVFRRDHLDKTHAFFAKHGGKTIIMTRFLPIVRTFAPFVAGMGAMTYKRFMAFNFIGGFLWVVSFVYAGHFFGNLPVVRKNFTMLIIGIIVISLLPLLIEGIRHRLKRASV